uniref:Uncharacterized protein n=1 Tax=Rhizophora mucronata TaxID=61149 RepID=A0A2P2N9Y6_RHIMU
MIASCCNVGFSTTDSWPFDG